MQEFVIFKRCSKHCRQRSLSYMFIVHLRVRSRFQQRTAHKKVQNNMNG